MNKIINFKLCSLILIATFIGVINFDTYLNDISLTHLNCKLNSNDSIEFQIYFDEKHHVLYYSDDFTALKGNKFDTSISPFTIKYHQERTFNDGRRTPITIFYDLDRHSLTFSRFIKIVNHKTKSEQGTCSVNLSDSL